MAEGASGIGTFEMDLASGNWDWSPQAAVAVRHRSARARPVVCKLGSRLFSSTTSRRSMPHWQNAPQTGSFQRRIPSQASGRQPALDCRQGPDGIGDSPSLLRGAIFDITERKALEARLLAVNETLEARVGQVREEARALEVLNRTGVAVAAEHDLERLVQMVTDAGVELSHAEFGAFFYNVIKEGGEAYTLYTLSGAPRERLREVSDAAQHRDLRADLPGPRPGALRRHSEPTRATARARPTTACPRAICRCAAILRFRSSRARAKCWADFSSVIRSPSVFTERAERIVTALAAQAPSPSTMRACTKPASGKSRRAGKPNRSCST